MTDEASILVSASPGEVRTALLLDEELREAWVERPARPDGVGDLVRARVSAIAPAMSGAFLALPGGETGFLPESEAGPERRPIAKAVTEGQILPVRITRAAQGGKGPRATARLAPEEMAAAATAPEGAPRLLRRGPDAPLRLAAAYPAAVVSVDSPALAVRLRTAGLAPERIRLLRQPAFDDTLEGEFDLLAGAEVPLPGGGRILLHPTPALTAIDVDAGTTAGGRDAGAVLRLNLAAAAEAARQIRLRNLAGPIFLDFAGLTRRRRMGLIDPMRDALKADPLARLIGLTGLGFVEIVRNRVHPPLHEVLGWPPSPLTRGLAALRRAAREAAARPGMALALRAGPEVVAALRALPGALEEAAAETGRALELRPDPALSTGPEVIEEGRHGR